MLRKVALVILGALASACMTPAPVSIHACYPHLDELVASAKRPERSEWWPAVRQLGRRAASDAGLRKEIWERARVNTLGMKFVEVARGRFIMGPDDRRVFAMAVAHPVEITQPFFVAVTEVTNAQMRELVPEFSFDKEIAPNEDSPALNVAWEQAVEFCKRLSEREGAPYRLPTEAEWEYACRAGSVGRCCFGDSANALSEFGWWDRPYESAANVASFKPNAWGMYDMHGNALEWVSDWFDDPFRIGSEERVEGAAARIAAVMRNTYYMQCAAEGAVRDPQGPAAGRTHVLRGGGWPAQNAAACSCTARYPLPIFDRDPETFFADLAASRKSVGFRQAVGFRVAREVAPSTE